MKAITKEWVDKAESDYDVVLTLRRSRKRNRFDPICFHCQQCAEKYLKARLIEQGMRVAKIHDLATLLHDLRNIEPLWLTMEKRLDQLSKYAVTYRYPDTTADRAEAAYAFATCKRMGEVARATLGLPTR